MPVGGIKGAAQDIKQRRESGGGTRLRYFKVKDGEQETVRFLEEGDGIFWCWTHKMPPVGNQKWGDDLACLDQKGEGVPCPGCEQGIPKKFKGFINLIWRGAPVFAQDSDGKTDWNTIVGREDQVYVWESGITVFEDLDGIDADYRGLKSRDFKVKRSGTGLNTKYKVTPADPDSGATPMSAKDQEIEGQKYDLNPMIQAPSYEDMEKKLSGVGGGGGQQSGSTGGSGGDVNPFLGERN